LLRAETEAADGQPELDTTISDEYIIAEDFDRSAYGLHDGEQFGLVTTVAVLTIEPRMERDYWVLRVTIERPLGPLSPQEQGVLERKELTLDEFETKLGSADPTRTRVRLLYETVAAKQRFDRWLADIRRRHPAEAHAGQL